MRASAHEGAPAAASGKDALAAPDSAAPPAGLPQPFPLRGLKAPLEPESHPVVHPSPAQAPPSSSRRHGVTFTPARTAEAAPAFDPLSPPSSLRAPGGPSSRDFRGASAAAASTPAVGAHPRAASAAPPRGAAPQPGDFAWSTPVGTSPSASLHLAQLRRLSGAGAGARPASGGADPAAPERGAPAEDEALAAAGPSSQCRKEVLRKRYAAALAGGGGGSGGSAEGADGAEGAAAAAAAAAPGPAAAQAAGAENRAEAAAHERGAHASPSGAVRPPLRTLVPRPTQGGGAHALRGAQAAEAGARPTCSQPAAAGEPTGLLAAHGFPERRPAGSPERAAVQLLPRAAEVGAAAPPAPRAPGHSLLLGKRRRVILPRFRRPLPPLAPLWRRVSKLPRLRVPSRASVSAALPRGAAGPGPVAITVTQNDVKWVPVPPGWGEQLAHPRLDAGAAAVPPGWGEQLALPRWETEAGAAEVPSMPAGWGEQLARPRWETEAEGLDDDMQEAEGESDGGDDGEEMVADAAAHGGKQAAGAC